MRDHAQAQLRPVRPLSDASHGAGGGFAERTGAFGLSRQEGTSGFEDGIAQKLMHIKWMMQCEGGAFKDEEASPPEALAKGARRPATAFRGEF